MNVINGLPTMSVFKPQVNMVRFLSKVEMPVLSSDLYCLLRGGLNLHSFNPTALKGCHGIVFTHVVEMGIRMGRWW